MKILAKMVNSTDLQDEIFDQLFKCSSDQGTLAVAPVVGVTQTVVTQPTFPNISSLSEANLLKVIDF
jgi:hypothetical protein